MTTTGAVDPTSHSSALRWLRNQRTAILSTLVGVLLGALTGASVTAALDEDPTTPTAALPATSTTPTHPAPARAFDVVGQMRVVDPAAGWKTGAACHGRSFFADIRAGLPVVVRTGKGEIVGVSQLTGGRASGSPAVDTCVFEFTVPAVAAGHGYYELAVGLRRGEYTEANLRQPLDLVLTEHPLP